MSKSIIATHLMLLGLVLVTMTARAAEPKCTLGSKIAECQPRIAQDQKILKQHLAAEMPTFLDIAKNADGKPKYMNQAEAIYYCLNQGAHLPSARELALLAMSLGARGIVDSCGSDNRRCFSYKAENADGSYDSFKFSYEGYQRPAGDLGDNWFWSSSVHKSMSYYSYILRGQSGHVGIDSRTRTRNVAVRCVSGR
jgi:uncharacterized protein (TIGR02145 family)